MNLKLGMREAIALAKKAIAKIRIALEKSELN